MNVLNRALRRRVTKWLLLSWILGCLCLSFSITLSQWSDSQSLFYNQAIDAYKAGNLEAALALFAKSQSAYQTNSHRSSDNSFMVLIKQWFLPEADRVLSAQASFQVAKTYIRAEQLPKAVQSFNQSLQLNPGNGYINPDPEMYELWHRAAMIVKYDLELLYKQHEEQMQAQGQGNQQGNGAPQDGDPQGSNRNDGNDPSQGAAGQGGSGQTNGSDM